MHRYFIEICFLFKRTVQLPLFLLLRHITKKSKYLVQHKYRYIICTFLFWVKYKLKIPEVISHSWHWFWVHILITLFIFFAHWSILTLHYGKKGSKKGKILDSYCKKVDPNLGYLEWSSDDFWLEITFGMIFFIFWAIENKNIPKKVHPSIFDFGWFQHFPP